jgi:hypothetical protein
MIRSRMRRAALTALTATSLALVVAPVAANASPSTMDTSHGSTTAGGPIAPNAWGLYGVYGSKSYCEDIGNYGQEVGHWSDWFCYPASTNSFWLYVNWR